MTTPLLLNEMSIEEKIQTMESLWDDLRTRAPDMASPDWHGEIIAGRQAAVERGEERIEDWETAKKKIKPSLCTLFSTAVEIQPGQETG